MRYLHSLITLIAMFAAGTTTAGADPGGNENTGVSLQKAAYAPATVPGAAPAVGDGDTLIFSAPPRESEDEAKAIYGPVADYLSKAIGKKIVFKYPGTWGVYRTKMVQGAYDLVFDGPHFCSYRAEKLHHAILVKIASPLEFVIITRKDSSFTSTQQLAGHPMCSHAPPNLGALVLLSQFDNPVRQPSIYPVKGWDEVYQGVLEGKCDGGVIPTVQLKKFDKNGAMRVVYHSSKIPNQAISAGPRISPDDQTRISQALLSPQAAEPTAKLRAAYKVGDHFVAANNQEYVGLAEYLRDEWGYY
jgi:ABC-type phosphate/phosphonate transport system substrate-binding protein